MIGRILTKAQVEKHGLKPTGNFYGTSLKPAWLFYASTKSLALLEESCDGNYLIISWVKR